MGTILYYTLRESLYRRTGLVLLGTSLLLTCIYFFNTSFETRASDGLVIVHSGRVLTPAPLFVKTNFDSLLGFAATAWLLLGIFAAAPLLTSYLEKGWVEMLLSKGVARWEVLLGRFLGVLLLFGAALLVLVLLPALYVWWGTGIGPAKAFTGLCVIMLGFAAVEALLALIAIGQPNPALLIMVGFLQWTLSNLLSGREKGIYQLIPWPWVRNALEFLYHLLPKNGDLRKLLTALMWEQPIESWYPLWSTAVFLVVALTLACYFIHRKSF